jgi:hypothetical protein
MNPVRFRNKNDYAGEDQQQLLKPDLKTNEGWRNNAWVPYFLENYYFSYG